MLQSILYMLCCWLSTTILAEAVRFELTDPFESTVFKTVAISRTLPRFHYLVPRTGFEPATELSLEQPRLPDCLRHRGIGSAGEIRTHDFTDLQSDPLDHSGTALHLASHHGFEPRPRVLETRMLPLH